MKQKILHTGLLNFTRQGDLVRRRKSGVMLVLDGQKIDTYNFLI